MASVNDNDPAVQYSTGWIHSENRNLGDIRNDLHYTKTDGAAVGYTFWGTGIEYIAIRIN